MAKDYSIPPTEWKKTTFDDLGVEPFKEMCLLKAKITNISLLTEEHQRQYEDGSLADHLLNVIMEDAYAEIEWLPRDDLPDELASMNPKIVRNCVYDCGLFKTTRIPAGESSESDPLIYGFWNNPWMAFCCNDIVLIIYDPVEGNRPLEDRLLIVGHSAYRGIGAVQESGRDNDFAIPALCSLEYGIDLDSDSCIIRHGQYIRRVFKSKFPGVMPLKYNKHISTYSCYYYNVPWLATHPYPWKCMGGTFSGIYRNYFLAQNWYFRAKFEINALVNSNRISAWSPDVYGIQYPELYLKFILYVDAYIECPRKANSGQTSSLLKYMTYSFPHSYYTPVCFLRGDSDNVYDLVQYGALPITGIDGIGKLGASFVDPGQLGNRYLQVVYDKDTQNIVVQDSFTDSSLHEATFIRTEYTNTGLYRQAEYDGYGTYTSVYDKIKPLKVIWNSRISGSAHREDYITAPRYTSFLDFSKTLNLFNGAAYVNNRLVFNANGIDAGSYGWGYVLADSFDFSISGNDTILVHYDPGGGIIVYISIDVQYTRNDNLTYFTNEYGTERVRKYYSDTLSALFSLNIGFIHNGNYFEKTIETKNVHNSRNNIIEDIDEARILTQQIYEFSKFGVHGYFNWQTMEYDNYKQIYSLAEMFLTDEIPGSFSNNCPCMPERALLECLLYNLTTYSEEIDDTYYDTVGPIYTSLLNPYPICGTHFVKNISTDKNNMMLVELFKLTQPIPQASSYGETWKLLLADDKIIDLDSDIDIYADSFDFVKI
jgi:hypothetical protein